MMDVLRITVFGTGYLGTVHAACMAQAGFEVLGVDTDSRRVAALSAGRPGIHEPGLEAMLCHGLTSGRLSFTTSYQAAAVFGDVHFICVGTPQRLDDLAGGELSHLEACLERLAPLLSSDDLVVGKSTVPVGMAARLAGLYGPAELAWNPGFLRERHAVPDTVAPDRIVAAVASSRAEQMLREVYAVQISAGVPFVTTDLAAEICEAAGDHAKRKRILDG